MRGRAALALLCVLVAAACARRLASPTVQDSEVKAQVQGDAPEAFAALVAAYDRVLRIGERLRKANTEACGEKVGPDLGWIVWAERDFGSPELRDLAKQFLAVEKDPVVVSVVPDGAAARAGVRVGDHVREVGGRTVESAARVSRAERALPETGAVLIIERNGEQLELTVEPTRACQQRVEPSSHESIEAWPGEKSLYVTLRLVELASDDEIAFSLAHALALDLLDVDVRRADKPYPEPETTRLAVQLSERAGFSVANVEGLLERQAIEQPWGLVKGEPSRVGEIPRRIVALKAVRESR